MASLYQEPDWSTKLETVKDRIIRRISGPGVRWTDALAKLKKYYYGKDFFSLTDVWAVMLVTSYVKEASYYSYNTTHNDLLRVEVVMLSFKVITHVFIRNQPILPITIARYY